VFFAVELELKRREPVVIQVRNLRVRTSLTGIEETPISIAMNQHALVQNVNGIPHMAKMPT
jgi:hypothetical protein